MSYQMNLAANASDQLISAKSAISDLIVDLPDNRIASEARSAKHAIMTAIAKVNDLRLSLALDSDPEWDGIDCETSDVYQEVKMEIEDQDTLPTLKKIDTSALEATLARLAEMAKEFKAEMKQEAKHESYCSTCGKPCEYIVKYDSEAHIVGDETQPGIYAVSQCCGSDVKADPELETEFTYFDETDVTERVG